MVTRLRKAILLLAFLVGCLWPSMVAAQTPTSVVLTIKPYNGQHEILELLPLVLTIELKNLGPGPAFLQYAGLTPDSSIYRDPPHYRFEVRRPDGTSVSVFLADWVCQQSEPSQHIAPKPGEKQRIEYCLGIGFFERPKERSSKSFEKRAAVFSEPGQYEIWLVIPYAWPKGSVMSNRLQITVTRPRTAQDLLAFGLLKDSRWPEILLTPLSGDINALGFPILPYPPILGNPPTTSPLTICRQILERCPDSAYVPYARSFLGSALASGWTEASRGRQKTNYRSRMEGFHLLQQAAKDPRLPLRFREQALVTACHEAYSVGSHLSEDANKQLPSLESVLGISKERAERESKSFAYGVAYRLAKGVSDEHDGRKTLRERYTPEQIEKLKAIAVENPHVPMADGFSPEHAELQKISQWASNELAKIPWRNQWGSVKVRPQPISAP